jgi:hypothetical protein
VSKFKVGDKVLVVGSDSLTRYYLNFGLFDRTGLVGVVKFVRNRERNMYLIQFNDEIDGMKFAESELEFARYKYTRLAEKMFPKGHREGDWWVLE